MNLSMIFPFYNEEGTLSLTIGTLVNQTKKADEIIFVDSGSSDNSIKCINKAKKDHPELNIRVIQGGEMFPSNSINKGIENSSNDLIMYMDCGLLIPNNWIESQMNKYIEEKADIVSGRIFTEGSNIIDKCFISHTYGYKNKCICLTGSIFDKKLLEKTGYFIENCRAGYDVDFINKLKLKNCNRVINKDVLLEYYGTNYSKSIIDGYSKVKLYSKSAWVAYGDKKPYLYFIILILLFIIISTFSFTIISPLLILYLLIRGFLIPYYKSKNIFKDKDMKMMIALPIVGVFFDLARINGYINGLLKIK